MNLKKSVWSNYFHDLSPEDTVLAFKKKGFSAMELSTEDGKTLLKRDNISKTAARFKSFIDSEGFTCSQGHLKLVCNICMNKPNRLLEELTRWIELYVSVGVKHLVLHVGEVKGATDDELLDRRLYALDKLTKALKDTDNFICLENLVSHARFSADLLKIINISGNKNLAICLDTGHLNLQKGLESQYDFIKNAGPHLKAIHIADNEGVYDQHLLPYSLGKDDSPDKYVRRINMEEVMQGLHEIGYNGLLNYEIPGETKAPYAVREAKLDFINGLSDYFLSLY